VRGKIARVLANQLCLAAKADAFSKRSISPMLKKKFDGRFAQIMKEHEAQKSAKAASQAKQAGPGAPAQAPAPAEAQKKAD
jgi:RNA processing factor Prp31